MKTNKIVVLASTAALLLSSCGDVELQKPMGNNITAAQITASIDAVPSLGEAEFSGLFTMMGYPQYALNRDRADDFGYIMMAISEDVEGADAIFPNSGYNWFSICGELSSRTANYANPTIRYATPYNQIKLCNDIIGKFKDSEKEDQINKVAQARALRAFAYERLAPAFQFAYTVNPDAPCVPMVTDETTEFANNPRASVKEVYAQILADLNYAIEHLAGYQRTTKDRVDQQVAYGLRARAYLAMGMYAEAAADAEKAMEGYTPASIADVSQPSFYDINDKNWIWGIDMTTAIAAIYSYATSSSWISSFSGDGYAAGAGCYCEINSLLYNHIPASDVRKGWWLDENLQSPLLESVTWNGVTGQAVASLEIEDVKLKMTPYTNVKFGMLAGVGATANDNDWPLMRVEEMILIQAEGYAHTNEAKAKEILTNFVKTYRDPEYTYNGKRTLVDEIWYQRRVELWGEGFFTSDANRLQKPIVRFHDANCNQPDDYRFNLSATDGWRIMRFPQTELNTNFGIVDNTNGVMPTVDQNPELRDGVTD